VLGKRGSYELSDVYHRPGVGNWSFLGFNGGIKDFTSYHLGLPMENSLRATAHSYPVFSHLMEKFVFLYILLDNGIWLAPQTTVKFAVYPSTEGGLVYWPFLLFWVYCGICLMGYCLRAVSN
jgi:hypothetical protein